MNGSETNILKDIDNKKNKKFFKRHWKGFLATGSIILVIIIGMLFAMGFGGGNNPAWSADSFSWYIEYVIVKNILGVPAILLAILTFIGYMVIKRGFVESLIGAIKTAVGVLLLSIGSTALTGLAKPIFDGITQLAKGSGSNLTVTPLDPYLGWTQAQTFLGSFGSNNYVSWISYVLLIGFALNLLLVGLKRWTQMQSIMVTGHIMFQQSAVVTTFIYILFFRGMPLLSGQAIAGSGQAVTIVFGGIFLGVYWASSTNLTIKPTNIITENAGFAVGHQQMLGVSLAWSIGKYFGDKSHSAEHRKLSKKFRIFEDNIFVQSVLILILFLVLIIVLQAVPFSYLDQSKNVVVGNYFTNMISNVGWWSAGNLGAWWVVQAIMGSLMTVAAILCIITGVRMFVTELQQSFQGISEKVIPGSVVAVDIAATYAFAPNAATYGFISGTVAQYVGVAVTVGLSFIPGIAISVVIPLFITLFFNSGAIGIFANASGGWKASIYVSAIIGFLEIIVVAFALGQLNAAIGISSSASVMNDHSGIPLSKDGEIVSPIAAGFNGMVDWNLFFGFPTIFSAMNPIVAYVLMPIEVVILIVVAQFTDTGLPNVVSPIQRLKMRKQSKNLKINN